MSDREVRYIAKCTACGCHTSGVTSGQNPRRSFRDPARTGDVYTSALGFIALDCKKCGGQRRANPVFGKFSAKHQCGARCLSATGTSCECSCGGKNHGAGHQAVTGDAT